MLYRRVEELLHLREGNDLIKFFPNFCLGHAEYRAIQEDVLPSRQFRVETGADFQQAGDSPFETDASRGRFGNPAQNLQQRRFTRAVLADDANHLTFLHLKKYLAQRPELLLVRPARAILRKQARRNKAAYSSCDHVTQRSITRPSAALVSEEIPLSQVLGKNDNLGAHDPQPNGVWCVTQYCSVSNYVGKCSFRASKIPNPGYRQQDDHRHRDTETGQENRRRRAEDRPAEPVDDSRHRIQIVHQSPRLGHHAATKTDRREVKTEL